VAFARSLFFWDFILFLRSAKLEGKIAYGKDGAGLDGYPID